MDYSFNSQYPFQWPSTFIPGNGFNAATAQPQHTATALQTVHTPTTPLPSAVPAVFPITQNIAASTGSGAGIPGFNGIGHSGGVYPFGLNVPFQNTPPNGQFNNPNWNYGYNNVAHYNQFPPPTQAVLKNEAASVPNGIVTNDNIRTVSDRANFVNDNAKEKNVAEGATTVNLGQGKDNEKKYPELSNDEITDQLIALKVSSLLSNSNILKNVISMSLQDKVSSSSTEKEGIAEQKAVPSQHTVAEHEIIEAAPTSLQSNILEKELIDETLASNITSESAVIPDPSVR